MSPTASSPLFRWLPAAVLVVLMPFLNSSYLIVVLPVLGLNLTVTAARTAPYEVIVAVMTLLALPYAAASLGPVAGVTRHLALLLPLLGLPWLGEALRRCAGGSTRGDAGGTADLPLPGGRGATPLGAALAAGLVVAAVASGITRQTVLAEAAGLLLAAVVARGAVSYARLSPPFLTSQAPTIRGLAGRAMTATATVVSQAPWPVQVGLQPVQPWAAPEPRALDLPAGGSRRVTLRMTPPLAGPGRINAVATTEDPWGLVTAHAEVALAEVRVIPRAAYAAWLAQRYLEQAQDGALPAGALTEPKHAQAARHGLDYYGARPYEPGDVLRDIFWKLTVKLGQIVVKDRRQGRGEPVIASVNLAAANAEEKDWLAHALLMSVLTLAREGVPVALAAYTPDGVVEVTSPLAPRPAVRAALSLVDQIHTAPRPLRVLAPPQSIRLRRTVTRLLAARSDEAVRTARLLALEHEALLRRMAAHPAAEALRRARLHVPTPAAVLPVTPDPDDLAILEVAVRHAPGLGFHILSPASMLPQAHILPPAASDRRRAHPRATLVGRMRAASAGQRLG